MPKKMDTFDRVFNSVLSVISLAGVLLLMSRYWSIAHWGDRLFLIGALVSLPYLPWMMWKENNRGQN